jgi:hypothetical protein
LRGRLRTTSANTNIRSGGNLAHTATTVLGQVKKSQQGRSPAQKRDKKNREKSVLDFWSIFL